MTDLALRQSGRSGPGGHDANVRLDRPDRRRSLQLHSSEQGTAGVIALAWAALILPSLVQSLVAPKAREFTGEEVTLSALASLVNAVCTFGLLLLLLVLVVRGFAHMPTERRGTLLILMLPWAYQISRDLFTGSAPQLGGLIYPLMVLAIWMHRPRLQQLSVLGYLVGLTAIISIAMGLLLPAKGILSSSAGDVITPTKQILSSGILIGPLTDGNPLGQFIALGVPAIFYIRHRGIAVVLAVLSAYAVVWTSNRSSILALGLGLAVAAMIRLSPREIRRAVTVLALTALAAAVAYFPLTTTENGAFTNRGYIWTASLRHWREHILPGLGSRFYAQSGQYSNNIGPTAFHGHNQFVQTVVLGGLINLALMIMLVGALIRMCSRWAVLHQTVVPAAFTAMVLFSSIFEITISLTKRGTLLPVVVIPILFICLARDGRAGLLDDTPARRRIEARPHTPSSGVSLFKRAVRTPPAGSPVRPPEPPQPVIVAPDLPSDLRASPLTGAITGLLRGGPVEAARDPHRVRWDGEPTSGGLSAFDPDFDPDERGFSQRAPGRGPERPPDGEN